MARSMWFGAAFGWMIRGISLRLTRCFKEYFGENPPARACVVSSMVIDCKVEVDCVAYKKAGG